MSFVFFKLCMATAVYCSTCCCKLSLDHEQSGTQMHLDSLYDLLGKLLDTYENPVILTNFRYGNHQGPKISISNKATTIKCFSYCPKIHGYILDSRKHQIDHLMKTLKSDNSLLNLRTGHFLILINDIANFSFSILLKQYISKVLVMDNGGRVFFYWPYKYGNMHEPDFRAYEIGCCKNVQKSELNSHYLKPCLNWANSTINVLLRVTAPYVTGQGSGIEEMFLKLLQERLKFNVNTTYLNFGATTMPYLPQKEELRSNNVDIFGGQVTAISQDVYSLDISPCYLYDDMRFVCPKPTNKSIWERVLQIFPSAFWRFFALSVVISTTFTKLFCNTTFKHKVASLLKIALGYPINFPQGADSTPNKIIFISWILFFMVVSTIFRNVLMVISETTQNTDALDTLDDIIKSKMPIYSMLSLKSLPVLKCENYVTCIKNVAAYQNSVSIGSNNILRLYMTPKFFIKDREVTIHISKEVIFSFQIQLLFPKGHPMFEQCSRIIQLSISNGWFVHQLELVKHELDLKTYQKYKIKSKKLNLENLEYVFTMWAGGIMLSVMVFGMECVIFYRKTH